MRGEKSQFSGRRLVATRHRLATEVVAFDRACLIDVNLRISHPNSGNSVQYLGFSRVFFGVFLKTVFSSSSPGRPRQIGPSKPLFSGPGGPIPLGMMGCSGLRRSQSEIPFQITVLSAISKSASEGRFRPDF